METAVPGGFVAWWWWERPSPGECTTRARVLDDANDRSLGTVVLEVERGSVTRIDLHPSLLDDDGVLAWAGRASSLAWFFVRGERDFDADPLSHLVDPDALRRGPARARRWAAAIGRAASRSIAFVDGRSIESEQMARALDARVVDLEGAPSPSEWGVESHVVSAVEIACPHCEATMTVDDLFAICPACDRRASTRALGRARVWSAVEDALVHRLRREAAQRTWWAVTSRSERVHQLRDRLGLQPWEQGEAPLLTGSEHAEVGPSTGVWSAAELWAQRGPAPEVFLIGLARDLGQLRALLARLDALEAGSRKIELLLGPIGFEASTAAPLRGERGRWTVARTEVEFRLRSRLRARATEP